MPPRKPRLATVSEVRFPTFEELAADARDSTPAEPYLLPIGKTVHEITLDADRFMKITRAQRVGDYESMYEALFPDVKERAVVRTSFKGAPPMLTDRLVGNVLSYYYGQGLAVEGAEGDEGN